MLLHFNNHELAVHFIGRFNASNLLAVLVQPYCLEKREKTQLFNSVPCSLWPDASMLYVHRGITAIDDAHTPDALINVLNAIHGVLEGKGKIITVVGAGGNRDKGKRPIMAKEAAKASDRVIITSDNPRFEEPQDMINRYACPDWTKTTRRRLSALPTGAKLSKTAWMPGAARRRSFS